MRMQPGNAMNTQQTTRADAALDRLTGRNPDLPRQEFFLTRMLFLASKKLSEFQSVFLRGTGMSLPQYRALSIIYSSERCETHPSRLRSALDSSRRSITRVADELIKNGWIERIHCAGDRRRQLLRITDKGAGALLKAFHRQAECQTKLWACFSKEERDALEDLLRRVYVQTDTFMPEQETDAAAKAPE